MSTRIVLLDTTQSLRLHVWEQLLPYAGLDAADLAPAVETYVMHGATASPVEAPAWQMAAHLRNTHPSTGEHHDETAETPPAAGPGTEGNHGGQPAEGDDLQRGAVAGNGGDDGAGEPGDAAPAEVVVTASEPPEELSASLPASGPVDFVEKAVRRLLSGGMRVSGPTLAADLNIAQPTASGHLRRLENAGLLRREGAGNKIRFVLAEAPAPVASPIPALVEPAAEIDVVVTRKAAALVVELPPPAVSVAPSAAALAAALVVDKPGRDGPILVARDVPQGQSWAFRDHRTLAEVGVPDIEPVPEPPTAPAQPPLPTTAERERLIQEHIAKHGVTTTSPEFGRDQPAVDVLRNACNSLVPAKPQTGPGLPRPWILNGTPVTTERLWKSANAELKNQGKRPIKRQA